MNWQPIETAPIEQRILVFSDRIEIMRQDKTGRWRSLDGLEDRPLYWMTLPDVPEGETAR